MAIGLYSTFHDKDLEVYERPLDEYSSKLRGGTKSGLHFFSALEFMRQCEAYIGNFQSALSGLFYQFMCTRHRGLRNFCPPKQNFAHGDYV